MLLVAFIVWLSTKAVSRMTAIVLGAKVIDSSDLWQFRSWDDEHPV